MNSSISKIKTDITIIGAGIYGSILSTKLSQKGYKIVLLEKQSSDYINNSRGNSGVLHSGVYYKNNSFKKAMCIEGNEFMKKYLIDNKIEFNMCGKLIAPNSKKEEEKIVSLHTNFKHGSKLISKAEVIKLGFDYNKNLDCLFVQNCGYTDPNKVFLSLRRTIDNINKGNSNKKIIEYLGNNDIEYMKSCGDEENRIRLLYNTEVKSIINTVNNYNSDVCFDNNKIVRNNRLDKVIVECIDIYNKENRFNIESEYVINCSGNNSICFAHNSKLALNYKPIDLNAIYRISRRKQNINSDFQIKKAIIPKLLVYPSPLNFSLGVHLTPGTSPDIYSSNYTKVGPSVDLTKKIIIDIISLLLKSNIKATEIIGLLKQLGHDYLNSSSKLGYLKLTQLFNNIKTDFPVSRDSEVRTLTRSPLFDLTKGKFESEFLINIETNNKVIHLLNIQSPGWTSSFAICDEVIRKLKL